MRIHRLHHPLCPGHLHRAIQNFPAAGLDPLDASVDRRHVEIKPPEGNRNRGGLVHHGADGGPARGEQLIGAHRPHIHRLVLGPAEQFFIEGERGLPIGRHQFVPARCAWRSGRKRRGRVGRQGLGDVKRCALRIGGQCEADDAGNLKRLAQYRASVAFDARRHGIDIVYRDVTQPGRTGAVAGHLFGNPQHAANAPAVGVEDDVVLARHAGILRRPAHHIAIEFLCRPGVGGDQFVSKKLIGHGILPMWFSGIYSAAFSYSS